MYLQEMFDQSPDAYQDLSNDNSQPRVSDLRKTRLTLEQIKKLRQMVDMRMVEFKEKLVDIQKQYKPPDDGGMGI
jgi:hypothetical protein